MGQFELCWVYVQSNGWVLMVHWKMATVLPVMGVSAIRWQTSPSWRQQSSQHCAIALRLCRLVVSALKQNTQTRSCVWQLGKCERVGNLVFFYKRNYNNVQNMSFFWKKMIYSTILNGSVRSPFWLRKINCPISPQSVSNGHTQTKCQLENFIYQKGRAKLWDLGLETKWYWTISKKLASITLEIRHLKAYSKSPRAVQLYHRLHVTFSPMSKHSLQVFQDEMSEAINTWNQTDQLVGFSWLVGIFSKVAISAYFSVNHCF